MITKLFDQLIYLILLCQPVDFYLKIYLILIVSNCRFLKKKLCNININSKNETWTNVYCKINNSEL